MRTSFYEFRVATSGLQVARAGLNTTSHNVANASNKGYSRQYIEQRAGQPLTLFNGRGMYGTGADVYGVGQHRNFYLDKKFWHENSIRGEYSVKISQLNLMETTISGSAANGGITKLFDGFFASLQDLSQNAGNATYRTNVITNAQTMAQQINYTAESLRKQQTNVNSEVSTMVQVINSLGSQIASLNRQIELFEQDGSRANDLRDQRTRIVDQLSGYINVTVREDELNEDYARGLYPEPEDRYRSNQKFTVLIDGQEFVTGDHFVGLEVRERELKLHDTDAEGLHDIYFRQSGVKLNLYSSSMTGELKGLIDIRDGNNSFYGQMTSQHVTVDSSGANHKLTLTKANAFDKWDFGEAGYIELTCPDTGRRVQVEYSGLIYNPNGSITLTLEKPDNINQSVFDSIVANIGASGNNTKTAVSIGRTTDYKGIPHYMNKLNELVRTFARAINEGLDTYGNQIPGMAGHINGYGTEGDTGNLFFSYTAKNGTAQTSGAITNYLYMNAFNFIVSPALAKNPDLLAANDNTNPDNTPSDESNNKLILGLIELRNYTSLFREGKLSDFIIGISSELGIDVRQAKKFEQNYAEIVTYVNNQREAVSGVSIDEELMNMIKYQQLYQAAAKLTNVIDEIYDICINRLGLAGR